jgi:hypothetical protein
MSLAAGEEHGTPKGVQTFCQTAIYKHSTPIGVKFYFYQLSDSRDAMKPVLITTLTFVLLCWANPALALQDDDTATIDAFISRQAKRERGEEYQDARKVVSGDLTHDGQPETVVLYTIEGQGGSNLHIQYLAVFLRRNGKLSPLTHMDVGGKSTRGVELISVENNSILLDTLNYGPKDASCCPSVKGKTSYVLSGGRLREQRRRKTR